jgi:membrane protein
MRRHPVVTLLHEVITQWQEDRALSHGAALAYYALFAMAPLLVLVIAVAGLVLGPAAAQGEIVRQVSGLMGAEGAKVIEGMILQASRPTSGLVASVTSLALMLFGATGLFGQLQASLNDIFRARPATGSALRGLLRQRATGFLMILGIGALLWLSLALSAALAAAGGLLAEHLPLLAVLLPWINFAASLLVVSALFALVFKVLPDVRLGWRDVWLGAAFTSLLFTLGKSVIGWYLGRAGTTSVYGAAGSLVLVLLWVYYSAQILFLGAEFTEVYARRLGSRQRE